MSNKKMKSTTQFTIEGWVARDECGTISLYENYPVELDGFWTIRNDNDGAYDLPKEAFPSLKWDDKPLKVALVLQASYAVGNMPSG
jgi:hypothetical protein